MPHGESWFNLLPWLFTSSMLSSTVVIPLVGKLGDIFGRKLWGTNKTYLATPASKLDNAWANHQVDRRSKIPNGSFVESRV